MSRYVFLSLALSLSLSLSLFPLVTGISPCNEVSMELVRARVIVIR